MFTSPGFIMGVVAVELLYGLFLFAVMSSSKRNRVETTQQTEGQYAAALPIDPPAVPKAVVDTQPTQPSPADTSKPTERAVSPTQPETSTAKEPSSPAPQADSNLATTTTTTKTKNETPKKSVSDKPEPEKSVAVVSPEATTPKPALEVPKPPTTFGPLGALVDPVGDTKAKIEDGVYTISVTAGPHIFDATRDIVDAPRALTDIEGDFVSEVKIQGDFRPGTEPLQGLNFTFQGAGLLVWYDKENYVRFERAAGYFNGERLQWIFIESCKDGKPIPRKPINVRNDTVTLRLERRGNLINYSYSLDGKTWLKADNAATTIPRKAQIGVSVSNAAPRPFTARFSNFVLKPAS